MHVKKWNSTSITKRTLTERDKILDLTIIYRNYGFLVKFPLLLKHLNLITHNLFIIYIFIKSNQLFCWAWTILLVFIFTWLSRRYFLYQAVNELPSLIEDSADYVTFARNVILCGPYNTVSSLLKTKVIVS